MPRGGARPGAGRKPKAQTMAAALAAAKADPVRVSLEAQPHGGALKRSSADHEAHGLGGDYTDPKAFLLDVMNQASIDPKLRVDAAKALVAAEKVTPAGKKAEKADAAKKAAGGKFAAAATPPRLVSSR